MDKHFEFHPYAAGIIILYPIRPARGRATLGAVCMGRLKDYRCAIVPERINISIKLDIYCTVACNRFDCQV